MTHFIHPSLAVLLCCLSVPLAAQERLVLPSGNEVIVQEILWDSEGATSRFRFVAPWIAAEGADSASILEDMTVLCRDFALPVQQALHPGSEELVISFASEPVEFGVMNSEVVQYFEGFIAAGQDCIWSEF